MTPLTRGSVALGNDVHANEKTHIAGASQSIDAERTAQLGVIKI